MTVSCKKEKAEQHPFVDFTYSGNIGVAPVTVEFKSNLSSPYVVKWDFGDGETGECSTVSHTYHKQGYFKVYAKAMSGEGGGQAVHDVNVSPYNKIRIYRINGGVSQFSPNGTTWDPEPGVTNPDMYFKIYSSSGEELTGTLGYAHDPDALSTQYPISPQVTINDLGGYFTVYFMDYDLGSIEDEVIGIYKFRPADYFKDSLYFPDHFAMSDSTTGASINVNLNWAN